MVLVIDDPKNAEQMGRQQVVTIRDPICIRWLVWICEGLPQDALVFPGGVVSYNRRLRLLLSLMGMHNFSLTMGSLRAGGTTHLFMDGVDIMRLRVWGRWRSFATLDHYVQEASSVRLLSSMSEPQLCELRKLLRLGRALRHPPRVPWWGVVARSLQERALSTWRSQPERWKLQKRSHL